MTSTCVCGAVEVSIQSRPEFINDCNCSLCRKTGSAWGYFPSASVSVKGNTSCFSRTDKSPSVVSVHACGTCGTTTHFTLDDAFLKANPGVDQVGVNMRLFEPSNLEGVEVRFPDGAAWSGDGPFGYRRPAITIGDGTAW